MVKPLCTQNGIIVHILQNHDKLWNCTIISFIIHPFAISTSLNPLADYTMCIIWASSHLCGKPQKSQPELCCSEDSQMYLNSPWKAAYNGAEQSEAGILKALLIWNTTCSHRIQLRDGRAVHRERCHKTRENVWDSGFSLEFTRVKQDTSSLHLSRYLIF